MGRRRGGLRECELHCASHHAWLRRLRRLQENVEMRYQMASNELARERATAEVRGARVLTSIARVLTSVARGLIRDFTAAGASRQAGRRAAGQAGGQVGRRAGRQAGGTAGQRAAGQCSRCRCLVLPGIGCSEGLRLQGLGTARLAGF